MIFGWIAAAHEPPDRWDMRLAGWTLCRGHQGSRCDCQHVLVCDTRGLTPDQRRGLAEADRPAWRLILLGVEEPAERAALLAALTGVGIFRLLCRLGLARVALFTDRRLAAIAESISLDMTAFNDCYSSGKFADRVQQDFDDATAAAQATILAMADKGEISGGQAKEIFEIVVRINRERGTTMLLVEQNASRALALADRGYVMDSGLVTMSGEAKSLLDDPRVREAYLGE